MSVLHRIAFYQNRRDEVPNQELAKALAETDDREGIHEIAAGLQDGNPNVQSDCLKVLYEIGYIKPWLIADYVDEFLKLIHSKNNRLVWGGMIALAAVAKYKTAEIWQEIDSIIQALENGSTITKLWGVKTLAWVAAADPQYHAKLFPVLLRVLSSCIARDVPTHAENMLGSVNERNQKDFLEALDARKSEMTPSQLARLKKVTRSLLSKP